MEFTFETEYNTKTMTEMARVLRKTVRKKHSRRSHIFGWLVIILGLELMLFSENWGVSTVVTGLAVAAILVVLLFEDRLNGVVAKKRLLPGTERAVTVFSEDGYASETEAGRTQWKYENILFLAETANFFVFLFSPSHAQLYDKTHLQGGTPEDFRRFIEEKAQKQVVQVK